MQTNKFVKNHNLSIIFFELGLIFLCAGTIFTIIARNGDNILQVVIICLLFVLSICFDVTYIVFQFNRITIDEIGIREEQFKKIKIDFKWEDINYIELDNKTRDPKYIIVGFDGRKIIIIKRDKIELAIKEYASDRILSNEL